MTTSIEKYALVTGASSGIGWHLSKELAAKGYSLVAVSNQAEQLLDLKTELEGNYPIRVITIDCDLAQSDAAEHIFDFCQKEALFIEVLVNNAGFLIYGEVFNVDLNRTKNILQLHMYTPVLLCRLFVLPYPKSKGNNFKSHKNTGPSQRVESSTNTASQGQFFYVAQKQRHKRNN